MRKSQLFYSLLAVGFTVFFISNSAIAQNISKTTKTGNVWVTIKVLPAESFTGSEAEMAWDGGAKPHTLNDSPKPNHHLVAFIKRNGEPVEHAKVVIHYRNLSKKMSKWMSLPIARMHVAGKGLKTTHYGNNVKLEPGKYEVRVIVDKNSPAIFHFTLMK